MVRCRHLFSSNEQEGADGDVNAEQNTVAENTANESTSAVDKSAQEEDPAITEIKKQILALETEVASKRRRLSSVRSNIAEGGKVGAMRLTGERFNLLTFRMNPT